MEDKGKDTRRKSWTGVYFFDFFLHIKDVGVIPYSFTAIAGRHLSDLRFENSVNLYGIQTDSANSQFAMRLRIV